MCGLIAYIGKKGPDHASDKLLCQYDRQSSRGTRGFGLIEINPKDMRIRRATQPMKFLFDIARAESSILLGHHRYPTSTDNELDQTHPIFVSHETLKFDWYVMHNGVISNDKELKRQHNELGIAYRTVTERSYVVNGTKEVFNDTEAFAIELARYLEGLSPEIGSFGSAAFMAVKVGKTPKKNFGQALELYFGRNDSNPLETDETEGEGLIIASDLKLGVEIPDNQALVFGVKELFQGIKDNKDILPLAATLDLVFAKRPVPPPSTTKTEDYLGKHYEGGGYSKEHWPAHWGNAHRPAGFRQAPADENSSTGAESKEEEGAEEVIAYGDEAGYIPTEREMAFSKMADRVIADISNDIAIFFAELAYEDPEEGTIDQITWRLSEILENKALRAPQVREHFDTQEAEEEEASRRIVQKSNDEFDGKIAVNPQPTEGDVVQEANKLLGEWAKEDDANKIHNSTVDGGQLKLPHRGIISHDRERKPWDPSI